MTGDCDHLLLGYHMHLDKWEQKPEPAGGRAPCASYTERANSLGGCICVYAGACAWTRRSQWHLVDADCQLVARWWSMVALA
jgi:hypothetical protein